MSRVVSMNTGLTRKFAVLGASLIAGVTGFAAVGASAHADTVNADAVHTVQVNENLSTIAKNANTTVAALASANSIGNTNLIYVGQQIKLDTANVQAQPGSQSATTYVTKSGDTLYAIANQFGTTVANLKALNGLTSDTIYVNQTLKVKADTTPQVTTNNNVDTTPQPTTNNNVATTPQPTTNNNVATTSQSTTNNNVATTSQPTTNNNVATTPQPTTNNNVATTSQPTTDNNVATTSQAPTDNNSAKEWIAQRESGGSYEAQNGRYYGRYQLDKSYLHGDYSAANQERVATQYMQNRYGSWDAAKAAWQSQGWW